MCVPTYGLPLRQEGNKLSEAGENAIELKYFTIFAFLKEFIIEKTLTFLFFEAFFLFFFE